ncbi:MAG: SLC13 family permease [Candidatus Krumholzibacteriota bacterium]|nr:SLC13 family permease [Candidatus Krumholzibacteriota bacterium]
MSGEIALVLSILVATIILFVTEKLRVDVIAILILLILAWTRLITPREAFSGLASNAVVAMMAVMVMGYGLDKSGFTNRLIRPIIRISGSRERGIISVISLTAGTLSAFMQNIGATALFIPAVKRISRKLQIPSSRLFMPMGFAAILGGTLTLVGSGPLIILNDLLRQGGLTGYGLFSVTPVGLALLAGGILYFLILGRYVLPSTAEKEGEGTVQRRVIETWDLPAAIDGFRILPGSPLDGMIFEDTGIWSEYRLNLLALGEGRDIEFAPWRSTRLAAGQELALLGEAASKEKLVQRSGMAAVENSAFLEKVRSGGEMAFSELILPHKSHAIGRTIRELAIRKNFSVEPVVLDTGRQEYRGDISDIPLTPGCTLIVYGHAPNIRALASRLGFIPVTPLEAEQPAGSKPVTAFLCFALAIFLVMITAKIPVALFSGALAMVLFRVIDIDELYRAIDWKTIFLIAGLIPLGIAMEKTGAAQFLALQVIGLLEGSHPLMIFFCVGILATIFSLFMSNVAATVLLVPLVIIVGNLTGINPKALAILVAVCAANSFILPTHQVNALLMTPGKYRNRDYIRAGGIMTLLFLLIAVPAVYLLF